MDGCPDCERHEFELVEDAKLRIKQRLWAQLHMDEMQERIEMLAAAAEDAHHAWAAGGAAWTPDAQERAMQRLARVMTEVTRGNNDKQSR